MIAPTHAAMAVPPEWPLRRTAWKRALASVGLGIALLAAVFYHEGAAAVHVWATSTAYNHCWLVLPVAAWLAWTRRERLAGLLPAAEPRLALIAVPLGLVWFVAQRLGIMEGRQLAALALIGVVVLATLGRSICRAMAAPLLYLMFLVPFGAFATPALQNVTAWMMDVGLGLLRIPHYRDGLIVETAQGAFHVAEACAGLRFIIAALAFGALYAVVMYRSPWRRMAVMVLAVVVPVLANGARTIGIVVLASYLGSAQAAAADHVIYGWGFFAAVILLLIIAGLPFRETNTVASVRSGARPRIEPRGAALVAALLAFVLATAGPALAAMLDKAGGEPHERAVALAAPAGCEAGSAIVRCEGAIGSVRLFTFAPSVTWDQVTAMRNRMFAGGTDEDLTFRIVFPGLGVWQGRSPGGASATAVATWLDGQPANDGLKSRLDQAWNGLVGGGGTPVIAVATLRQDSVSMLGPERVREVLQHILAAQTNIMIEAKQLSRATGHRH